MTRLGRLRVYPVKGLEGIELDAVEIREGGTLAYDREFALFDDAGEVINGKRTDRVHDLATDFEPATREFTVDAPGGDRRRFDLGSERGRDRAEAFFAEFFDEDVTLRRDATLGYVDRREMGPSVISTATLRTVASWFDEMTVEGARRRFRANVEVADVAPFWEDRFVGEDAPAFRVGDVRFEGVTPCGRCVVPQRDPETGEPTPEFRQRFVEKRRETFPEWADPDAFDHHYALMLIARVADRHREEEAVLAVDDPVAVLAE